MEIRNDLEKEERVAAMATTLEQVDYDAMSNEELVDYCFDHIEPTEFSAFEMLAVRENATGERTGAAQVIEVCRVFGADHWCVLPLMGYLPSPGAPHGSRRPEDWEDAHALVLGPLAFRYDRVVGRALFVHRCACSLPCRRLIPWDAALPSRDERMHQSVH